MRFIPVCFLFILLACTAFPEEKPALENVSLKIDESDPLVQRYCNDFFTIREYYYNRSPAGKQAILEVNAQKVGANVCYIDIAEARNDEAICYFMENTFQQSAENATEVCLAHVGAKNDRPELCEQLEKEWKDLCLRDLEFYREQKNSSN